MSQTAATNITYLKDYQPPAFWVDEIALTFDLEPAKTRVLNVMRVRRNLDVPAQPLRLDGVGLTLSRVLVNGQGISFTRETDARGEEKLVLEQLPQGGEGFELEILTTCAPIKNTALSGLYVSNDSFFTQCEAEGFRRMTYALDRPDVMSVYTVTLRADKKSYPVLLSNGNLVEQGALEAGRHFAKWCDPHKKPGYLFALVAGNLVCREQRIRTRTGSSHLLQVYVRPGDLEKTGHAMRSLIASIAWDEARFGLKLDLERFMIVAVSDFNMGAMENKGLNIFNTRYVLANASTATDADFEAIESVVAHEYFHNWTGNRVTCRDWFQLSLKEGLTVFRDQEFSQDMSGASRDPSAAAVRRIEVVRNLRQVQFAEDAGPMSHPVRPQQYQEINNFYTSTVYEKGAEVVRMMQALSSREGFARGLTLYFERHDGKAVTCDDFVQAMADANSTSALAQHLPQFKRWYAQAGTPTVQAQGSHDAASGVYTLTLRQSCGATPGQTYKEPLVIPVAVGLVGEESGEQLAPTRMVVLTQTEQTVEFEGIWQSPVPSLLRGFSAPVNVVMPYSEQQLLTLVAHDSDPFNRWEAAQRLLRQHLLAALVAPESGTPAGEAALAILPERTLAALRRVLQDRQLDAGFRALVLTLPGQSVLAQAMAAQPGGYDPQRVHAVRERARLELAQALHDAWGVAYEENQTAAPYSADAQDAGKRSLTNYALTMLCAARAQDAAWQGKTYQRFKDATNMTERLGALQALLSTCAHSASAASCAQHALQHMRTQFAADALVMDKWFALQALHGAPVDQALQTVRTLMQHADFNAKNPNRFRALVFSFVSGNPAGFHRPDGSGYDFWADQVLALDASNPQVAARLARLLERWEGLAAPYQALAHRALQKVEARAGSRDVREIIRTMLAQ